MCRYAPSRAVLLSSLLPAFLGLTPSVRAEWSPPSNAKGQTHVLYQRHPRLVSTPTTSGRHLGTGTNPGERSEEITLENVRWGFAGTDWPSAVFKTTTFDVSRIKDVFYWSEDFPPKWIAAHGMLAFVMDDPEAVRAEDGSRDIGFVMTVDPYQVQEEKFKIAQSLQYGYRTIVHSVTTLTDRLQWGVLMRHHCLDQYRLRLDQEQKEELVRHVLLDAAKPRPEEGYHLIQNSCITGAALAMNHVLEGKQKIGMWWVPGKLRNLEMAYPKTIRGLLLRKGIAERAPKIRETVKRVTYPTRSGEPFVIDLTKLPGFRFGKTLIPFDDALEFFFQHVRAHEDLFRLQNLLTVDDPRLWSVHRALAESEEMTDEALVQVLDRLEEHPVECLDHYLSQKMPRRSQAVRALDTAILQRLQKKSETDPALRAMVAKARRVFSKR